MIISRLLSLLPSFIDGIGNPPPRPGHGRMGAHNGDQRACKPTPEILVLSLSPTHPTTVGKCLALSRSLKWSQTGCSFSKLSPSPTARQPVRLLEPAQHLVHTSGHRPPKQTPVLTSFQPGRRLSPHGGDLQTNQAGVYQRPCTNKQRGRRTGHLAQGPPRCGEGVRHQQVC